MRTDHTSNESGFTLIELSIVLVIIGLIVGGVLVGQQMVKASQIRNVISQFEKYNTAVNTFRSKYNGVPGDMYNATTFWPSAINGDGNSLLTDTNGALTNTATDFSDATGELMNFFYELSQANLVEGVFSNAPSIAALSPGGNFPTTKLGGGVIVMSINGQNRYHVGMNKTDLTGTTVFTFDSALSPVDALQIDTKMDDGRPEAGSVVARTGAASANIASAPGSVGDNQCLATATSYNVSSSNDDADTKLCQLQFRMN